MYTTRCIYLYRYSILYIDTVYCIYMCTQYILHIDPWPFGKAQRLTEDGNQHPICRAVVVPLQLGAEVSCAP